MASISSGANGPWSSPATWTGGVVPGPDDDVTLAGHTVTIDQDITVSTLRSNASAGELRFSGDVYWTVNVTGTVSIFSSAKHAFVFSSSYTGHCVFNIGTISLTSNTSASNASVFEFEPLSAGTIDVNAGEIQPYGSATGGGPAAFMYIGDSSRYGNTNLNLKIPNVRTGRFSIIRHYAPGSGTRELTAKISIDIENDYIASAQYGSNFIDLGNFGGEIVFEKAINVVGSSVGAHGLLRVAGSSGTNMQPFKIWFKGAAISPAVANRPAVLVDATAYIVGSTVQIDGDVENMSMRFSGAQLSVTIDGDLLYENTYSAPPEMIYASSTKIDVYGNLITTTLPVIRNIGSSVVRVGRKDETREYVMSAPYGISAVMGVGYILLPGVRYRVRTWYGSNWPDPSVERVVLSEVGAGPDKTDVRAGVSYATNAVGSLPLPLADSVRAGVEVGTEVGTAMVDIKDLAAITGTQIASLSE